MIINCRVHLEIRSMEVKQKYFRNTHNVLGKIKSSSLYEQFFELLCGQRFAEVITLPHITSQKVEELPLFHSLNSFGNGLQQGLCCLLTQRKAMELQGLF
jgi:hypothetical protein